MTDFAQVKDKDSDLYLKWKEKPSKGTLGALIQQLQPLINKEVSGLAGSVPTPALRAEANKWAVHAIKTYDPSRGTQLSTHVTTWLQKVKRVNYKSQNAARLAENQQLKFNEYNTGKLDLATQLNRDPQPHELAKHLGWSTKQVEKFQGELFNDFYESGSDYSPAFTKFDSNKVSWNYVMENLTPEEKRILDVVLKADDGPTKMSSDEIAKELGVNVNRYNYLRRKLVDRMSELQKEMGEF